MDVSEIIVKKLVKNRVVKPEDLASLKRAFAKEYHLSCPKSSSLLQAYHNLVDEGKIGRSENLEKLLRTRKMRSLSGIVSVSVLTKPYPCPGSCLYCPTQKGLPKSYLDGEPAVMRALANRFDPYLQVRNRLDSLRATGHETGKIELIIIGGTWSALPARYQEWFVKECFRAANHRLRSTSLIDEQKKNEKARHRIIGVTIETRPDFINGEEVKRLRKLGITRVELGVQSLRNDVLKKNLRGHLVSETIRATRLLKESGFKVCYHLMPNLLGSSLKKDEEMFSEVFQNPDFRPDFLKIYPCVVVKEAPLYRLWLKKKYRSYSDRQLIDLLKKVKQKIPVWCRVIRVYRDIPSSYVVAGSKVSNLREVVLKEMEKEGKKCRCIRCREAKQGFSSREDLQLFRQDYSASDGQEIFLSFEDKKRRYLYSLLRLRLPRGDQKEAVFPVLEKATLIREIHTYGQALALGEKTRHSPQHQSLGKDLIKEAERIAQKEGFSKMAIIAGVGTRGYYRRLGYRLRDTYMIKRLSVWTAESRR
ncbi:MAG: tRNA uridine(34) 5-carboxymethylaminomethyl modification radical SAM/GNAT enzyme Elp3 [Candidatus Nealsonbacteria bacterium]|nr:tRNA uridine(34) 5-carboxymethylaminomethyl modification radical SAM/GNAT enzyme Elp3 [Candidatus Nealsonbacteria bacterium]